MKKGKNLKAHLGRLCLFIWSLVCIFGLIRMEYQQEGVAEQKTLYFQVQDEIIQTWEKDGILYLFLPSFATEEDVTLAAYSPEFYVMGQNKKISNEENLQGIPKNKKNACQFIKTGEKFELYILKSENVSTIFVDTQSGGLEELKADKEYVVAGTVNTINADGIWEEKLAISSIGGRGNTSFAGYEKKPFSITLEEEASLLGLPKGRKYALISNASDPSLVRNDMVRRMEVALGLAYSHTGEFVDLYVNGEYEGNYYLVDDIEIGYERIPINNMESLMKLIYNNRNYESEEVYETEYLKAKKLQVNPANISGGYLIEREYVQRFEHEYDQIQSAFITSNQEHFVVKNPRVCSVEQITYISDYVNQAERAILSPDGYHPETHKYYTDYINLDSFVKKYLVEEVSKNYDAGVTSSYFYKDSDLYGGRLCAAPGWDYDMSLGNYVEWMEEFSSDPTGISELAFHTYATSWYTELYQKEDFYQEVRDDYAELVSPFLENMLLNGIDSYEKELEASAKMNEVRWQEELKKNPYYVTRKQSFVELKDFIRERKNFLDEAWKKESIP